MLARRIGEGVVIASLGHRQTSPTSVDAIQGVGVRLLVIKQVFPFGFPLAARQRPRPRMVAVGRRAHVRSSHRYCPLIGSEGTVALSDRAVCSGARRANFRAERLPRKPELVPKWGESGVLAGREPSTQQCRSPTTTHRALEITARWWQRAERCRWFSRRAASLYSSAHSFAAAAQIARAERVMSASVVLQLLTESLIRRMPCHVVAPIQHSPLS